MSTRPHIVISSRDAERLDELLASRPGGGTMRVRIEEVIFQPERVGEFHR